MGATRRTPGDFDHPGLATRRRRPAHRMDGGIAPGQKVVAAGNRDVRPKAPGKVAGGGLEFGGAEVVGGGVDQVPGEGAGVRDPGDRRRVDALDLQGRRGGVTPSVAIEAVEAEGEGDGGVLGRKAAGRALKPEAPGRKPASEGPEGGGVPGGKSQAQQDPGWSAIRSGNDDHLVCSPFKVRGGETPFEGRGRCQPAVGLALAESDHGNRGAFRGGGGL